MWFLVRSLVLWLILLASAWLYPRLEPGFGLDLAVGFSGIPGLDPVPPARPWFVPFLTAFSMPLAVFLTWLALLRLPTARAARVVFWAITGGLWLLALLIAVGVGDRLPETFRVNPVITALTAIPSALVLLQFLVPARRLTSLRHPAFLLLTLIAWGIMAIVLHGYLRRTSPTFGGQLHFEQTLVLSFQLALVVAVLLVRDGRRWPSRAAWAEAAAGVALIPAILVVAWLQHELRLRSQRRAVLAAWTARGLPLLEFERTLVPATQSDSYRLACEVLDRWCGVHGNGGQTDSLRSASNPVYFVRLDEPPSGDDVKLDAVGFGADAENFAADGRRLLAAEPPRWAWNSPGLSYYSGMERLPLHAFTDFAIVHAVGRLQAGDEAGAAQSLAAIDHLYRNYSALDRSPSFQSFGDHLQGVTPLVTYRALLSTYDDPPEAIRRDLATWGRTLDGIAQLYSGRFLRVSMENEQKEFRRPIPIFPRWAQSSLDDLCARADAVQLAQEHTRPPALRRIPEVTADIVSGLPPDLPYGPTVSLNPIYLLAFRREVAQLIRTTRARLIQGLPLEEQPCVVAPTAHWEISLAPGTSTVTFQLVDAPDWLPARYDRITWKYRLPVKTPSNP